MSATRLTIGEDKKVFGVCSGFAEYFDIDTTLVRLGVALGTFFTGGALIPVYIIAALVMPNQ